MEHQDKGWADLGKTLLIMAMGHGWVALLIFLSIIAMTYVAAYFLVSAIKGREGEGIAIITPFLKIKTQPSDNHDQQKLSKLSDGIKGFNGSIYNCKFISQTIPIDPYDAYNSTLNIEVVSIFNDLSFILIV